MLSAHLSFKAVARDVLILAALTGIAGFYVSLAMPGKLGTPEHQSMSGLLTLVLVTVGFVIVAARSSGNRWLHIAVVVVLLAAGPEPFRTSS